MKNKKNNKEGQKNILVIISIVIVLVALFNLVITFTRITQFNKDLTGYAVSTSTAYINLTVNTNLAVDFTPKVIYWGPGMLNGSGNVNANLTTLGNSSRVQGGNWSNSSITGLIIKNIGNINGSLNFTMGKNVTLFFGPNSHTSKNYSINISNKEAGSCNSTLGTFNAWIPANGSMWRVCNNFGADNSYNELWLNVHLTIPYDANTTGAEITDTYTATMETIT